MRCKATSSVSVKQYVHNFAKEGSRKCGQEKQSTCDTVGAIVSKFPGTATKPAKSGLVVLSVNLYFFDKFSRQHLANFFPRNRLDGLDFRLNSLEESHTPESVYFSGVVGSLIRVTSSEKSTKGFSAVEIGNEESAQM